MSKWTQFYLLLYKNWKLQFRKKIITVFEILLPVLFCLLLVVLRGIVKSTTHTNPTVYPAYGIESLPQDLLKVFRSEDIGIAYTPRTTITDDIMNKTVAKLSKPNLRVFKTGADTESAMVDLLQFSNSSITNENRYLVGVVFNNPDAYRKSVPFNISYTIRPPYQPRNDSLSKIQVLNSWQTRYLYIPFPVPGPRDVDNLYNPKPGYYVEGFLSVQFSLHRSVIEHLNPSVLNDSAYLLYNTNISRFPYPPYIDDPFLLVIQTQLPFLVMLSLIFVALNIPKEVIHEKERKLKEAMKMMGLSNWLHWLAWFTKFFVFLALTALLMSLMLCPRPHNILPNNTVFRYTDFGVIYVFLLLYCISIICFCFMISVFFNKANSGAAAGGILFFATYIPFSFIQPRYDNMSFALKLISCLLNQEAMAIGMMLIGKWEGTGVGAQFDNLNTAVSVDDNFTVGHTMLMMLADSVIYIVIMWYVEAVKPGDYGIPQPPYFFLLPSYWCGTVQDKQIHKRIDGTLDVIGGASIRSEFFEPEPINLQPGIQIKGLTKSFKDRNTYKLAVDDMNLNMYDGQITALLGHNGAGKTTTMFMLTGFIPPTTGTATVNGYDIQKDISSVRASLGLCPQHDILFDDLTVEEHLYFFAKLKQCPALKIQTEIDYYLNTLGLEEKRKSFAKTLSGGQKRKLSVGIALIGDSKIVILDEPTSGMDPSARRHMWDVLQAQRAGRTMILSTHFMDEADHLGDRIAIMADGVVQCCGSSLFLKNKFGAGYHMVMTKKEHCDVTQVERMLQKHVPQAKLENNVGAELSFILPHEQVSAFPDMFRELEQNKEALGIMGYGASVTTMEEVFMKVGNGKEIAEEELVSQTLRNRKRVPYKDLGAEEDLCMDTMPVSPQVNQTVVKVSGLQLFMLQFKAMFIKRVLYTLRNKLLTGSQLVLPLFFTALTIAVMKSLPGDTDDPLMPLDIQLYGTTKIIYGNSAPKGSTAQLMAEKYSQQVLLSTQTLLGTSDPFQEIITIGNRSMKDYNFETIVAADFRSGAGPSSSAIAYFNAQPFHAAPLTLLYTDTALLHTFVNSSFNFAAANYPLPQTTVSKINALAKNVFDGQSFAYSSNIVFGMSFLASSFVVFLITERARKIKHSQIVSGVKWYNFWLSTYCWDFINYIIPSALTLVLYAVADIKNLADVSDGNTQPLYLTVLLVLFGITVLPSMYLVQFLFTAPATGYVLITFFNILTGVTPQLVVTILQTVNETRTADLLDWVFVAVLPNYNLGQGVSNIYNNYNYLDLCLNKLPTQVFNKTAGRESLKEICQLIKFVKGTLPCCKDLPEVCGASCLEWQTDYFSWENLGIGRSVLFLCLQCVAAWLLIVLIETELLIKLFYRFRPKTLIVPEAGELQDDVDIAEEKLKIIQNRGQEWVMDPVVISGLSKYYAEHRAVDQLYVSIPKGECFGLLGVNGAGKTTTFRMLTGDETVSGGTAFMNGSNIRTDIHEVQKSIGYCPQFDALIDQMTGEETLYMYARLRGVPEKSIKIIVDNLMKALLLEKHSKKLTMQYSGGNKRKLSTAIALIGDSPIIFLDEPTTGMDPVARRMLWETLSRVRDSGKTLILTSHSMEECEALCTRMAIMVNGKFRCLGSTQHLKNKFGAGYTLVARVSYPADGSMPNVKAVQTFVEQSFRGSVLKDIHQNLVQYHISKGEVSWPDIFKLLEENKVTLNIEDYSVSQTTLEQVFINFARSQIPPNEEQDGCSSRLRKTCCICCVPEIVVETVT